MSTGIAVNGRTDSSLLDAVYHRLTHSRADEISRLKEERLSRQLRDKEMGIRRIAIRNKEIRLRFELFMNACMQDAKQRVARIN